MCDIFVIFSRFSKIILIIFIIRIWIHAFDTSLYKSLYVTMLQRLRISLREKRIAKNWCERIHHESPDTLRVKQIFPEFSKKLIYFHHFGSTAACRGCKNLSRWELSNCRGAKIAGADKRQGPGAKPLPASSAIDQQDKFGPPFFFPGARTSSPCPKHVPEHEKTPLTHRLSESSPPTIDLAHL